MSPAGLAVGLPGKALLSLLGCCRPSDPGSDLAGAVVGACPLPREPATSVGGAGGSRGRGLLRCFAVLFFSHSAVSNSFVTPWTASR